MTRLIQKIISLFLIHIVIISSNAVSQTQQVPFQIQAAYMGKILNHIFPLKDINPIKVLIVYDNNSASDKTILVECLNRPGIDVNAVEPFQIVMNIPNYNVIYFMNGTQSYSKLCREYKVLSICGNPDYVKNGNVSIAIGIEQDKPKVFINLGLLQAEGKNVSGALLNISNVFR